MADQGNWPMRGLWGDLRDAIRPAPHPGPFTETTRKQSGWNQGRKSPNAQVKDANDVLARGGSQREQSQATLHSWKGNRQSGWNDTVFGSPRAHFDAGHQSGTIN